MVGDASARVKNIFWMFVTRAGEKRACHLSDGAFSSPTINPALYGAGFIRPLAQSLMARHHVINLQYAALPTGAALVKNDR